MGTKMGRPTEDPKNVQIRIRMTNTEKEMLEYCASCLNCTKTDVIIKGVRKIYQDVKENSSC